MYETLFTSSALHIMGVVHAVKLVNITNLVTNHYAKLRKI